MNIVVTGAAHGLGAALSKELQARGHSVGELDICYPEGPWIIDGAKWQHNFDVADAAAWEALAAELGAHEWHPDLIINNAGIGVYGAIDSISVEDWQRQLDISLTGPWLSLKYLSPLLGEAGRVVNIGSRRGLWAVGERTAYCAAKFGLRGLSLAAAAELNNRVSIVELDSMLTDFTGALEDKKRREAAGEHFLHPDEVASAVADMAEGKKPWLVEWRLRATASDPLIEEVTETLW